MDAKTHKVGDVVQRVFVLLEEQIPAALLVIMTAVTAYGAFSRYILDRPIATANELALTISLWVIFLGAAGATRIRLHVGIDFIVSGLPDRYRAALDVLVHIVLVVVMGMLTYLSVELVLGTRTELFVLEISKKWMLASMPTGLILTTIHLGQGALSAIHGWRTGHYEGGDALQNQAAQSASGLASEEGGAFDPTQGKEI